MSSRVNAQRQAEVIYTDATTIAAGIQSALRNLDTGKAGFKTGHDGTGEDPGSITERIALAPTDQARRDEAELHRALQAAMSACRHAAAITQRWATFAVGGQSLVDRVTAADAGIWCSNCSSMGHKNPKAPSATECEFCAQFRRDYKRNAPKDVLDLRSTKGRIYVQDIDRILRRLDTEAKQDKKRKKDAA